MHVAECGWLRMQDALVQDSSHQNRQRRHVSASWRHHARVPVGERGQVPWPHESDQRRHKTWPQQHLVPQNIRGCQAPCRLPNYQSHLLERLEKMASS